MQTSWEAQREFENKLKWLVRAELKPRQVWDISVGAPPTCAMNGWIAAMRFPTDGISYRWEWTLDCRVPEKNLFPSEKMLHFMGVAKLPTKRAKPRDWEEMATLFGKMLAEQNP